MRKLTFSKLKALSISLILVAVCVGVSYNIQSNDEKIISTSIVPSKSDRVIILDAGHGGMDGGCTSADGTVEKDINLNILLNLRDMLTATGYTVEVTRDSDKSIHDKGVEGIANQKSSDMDNRLALFNKYDNAVCVSIHQNQFTDSKYSGAQMFYSDTNSKSETLARIMQDNFVKYLQPNNAREIKLCGKELFLCYFSENPTVMAECGFLSNPEEAEKLKDEEYQKEVAFTIYSSICEFCSNY
ncbi:MAG: N-acetylmuramoyl-L-alanine amidase [Oscillospiraceae bacterium]